MIDHKILVKNTNGATIAEITDFLSLTYTKRVNEPGLASILLPGAHSVITSLADKYQVEIWRRDVANSLAWYCDFYGFYRYQQRYYRDKAYFLMRCPGQLSMLGWRYVLYYSGTDNRNEFTSELAEDIAYNLVYYNAGTGATTANSRLREGRLSQAGLTLNTSATSGLGNTLDWSCAWKNTLTELQAIAKVGGGDFDITKTGAKAWSFDWYAGQRGTDLSSTVTFALEYGNMANPSYTYDRIMERTAAVVGGQGETSARSTAVRTGSNYTAANDIEIFVDARARSTAAGLNAAGDERLATLQGRESFDFDVLQVPSTLYGVHYCAAGVLGDLVTARYDTVEVTQKIIGVTVSQVAGRGEQIEIDTETQ